MAKLTKKDVLHVAKLSSVSLSDENIVTFQEQLSRIIEYIDELQEVDVESIEPTSQTTGLSNITREDKINPERILSQENALSGTENKHNGYFQVPPVIEKQYDDR